jgi:hypothetical protein
VRSGAFGDQRRPEISSLALAGKTTSAHAKYFSQPILWFVSNQGSKTALRVLSPNVATMYSGPRYTSKTRIGNWHEQKIMEQV